MVLRSRLYTRNAGGGGGAGHGGSSGGEGGPKRQSWGSIVQSATGKSVRGKVGLGAIALAALKSKQGGVAEGNKSDDDNSAGSSPKTTTRAAVTTTATTVTEEEEARTKPRPQWARLKDAKAVVAKANSADAAASVEEVKRRVSYADDRVDEKKNELLLGVAKGVVRKNKHVRHLSVDIALEAVPSSSSAAASSSLKTSETKPSPLGVQKRLSLDTNAVAEGDVGSRHGASSSVKDDETIDCEIKEDASNDGGPTPSSTPRVHKGILRC